MTEAAVQRAQIALVGNPNSGKTTLFNSLTGLRLQTGNFAGTTVARKQGIWKVGEREVDLIDLPGMYSLEAATPEEKVASDMLHGRNPAFPHPELVVVALDATNLERNLFLFSQVAECGPPVVVALTMMDLAHREGMDVDAEGLSRILGCKVVPVNAAAGEGLETLAGEVEGVFEWGVAEYPRPHGAPEEAKCGVGCRGCPFGGRFTWGEHIVSRVVRSRHAAPPRLTDSLDEVLTHPVLGMLAFLGVMIAVFMAIFSLATVPMDLIEHGVSAFGNAVGGMLPEGDLQSLIVDGVITGVGSVVVFLPQICLLFFLLPCWRIPAVPGRVCHGPGHAQGGAARDGVCALLWTRLRHSRHHVHTDYWRSTGPGHHSGLAAVVRPGFRCMDGGRLLFPHSPFLGALVLRVRVGHGGRAGHGLRVQKKRFCPGKASRCCELPVYKAPNLRNALMHTYDKALVFLNRRAGLFC